MRPRIPPSALVLAIGGSLTVVELLLPDGPARQALFVVVALGCALTVAMVCAVWFLYKVSASAR